VAVYSYFRQDAGRSMGSLRQNSIAKRELDSQYERC
jgi:hypothetical protein